MNEFMARYYASFYRVQSNYIPVDLIESLRILHPETRDDNNSLERNELTVVKELHGGHMLQTEYFYSMK